MQTLLSVIIPVYKVENYIRQCLNSIVTDMPEGVEIIVVDDGSPDASGQIADEYTEKYPCLKVIHKKNAGVAAARNTGMDMAQGKWLYFVDSDDWLVENGIDKICKVCCKHQNADVILLDAWQVNREQEWPWEHFRTDIEWQKKDEIHLLQRGMLYYQSVDKNQKVPLAAPWDKVYQKEFLEKHHLYFPENLKVLDDMIFNMQVFGKAEQVAYVKEKIYNYRYVPDSITNTYKSNRVELDCEVWDFLKEYQRLETGNWTLEQKNAFEQALYCRIIKSFSICCRLSFFNPENKKSLCEKLRYVKDIMMSEPYRSAFQNVWIKNAEWRLKPVILFGRWRCSFGIYMLHLAQNFLQSVNK